MDGFKNILVLYGHGAGSESALTRAEALAKAHGARLSVAVVAREGTFGALSRLGGLLEHAAASRDRLVAEAGARLERLCGSLRRRGVDTAARVLDGRPELEIPRAVLRNGHDLVILPDERTAGARAFGHGGLAARMARECPCPVWVARSEGGDRLRRVAVAVKAEGDDARHAALDRRVVEMALAIARFHGCALDVIHAWDYTGRDLDTSRSETTPRVRTALFNRNRSIHAGAVRRLLAKVGADASSCAVHLPKGTPEEAVNEVAARVEADLIVVGLCDRPGLAGLLGDCGMRILRHATRPVMVVKPADYVAPMALEERFPAEPAEALNAVA